MIESVDGDGVISFSIPFFRTPYNYDTLRVSDETGLFCPPAEGMTQQQFKEESDINEIVRRFGLTGEMPENFKAPQSGDFTDVDDFASAMQAVRQAEESFMLLPADVRSRFANDPQRLMEFCADDGNRAEALKLGLLNPPVEKTRDVVQAVDELASRFPIAPKV